MSDSRVLGAVVLFRHGDRQGFYQSDSSYTASHTTITPLGEVQHFQNGQALRARYLSEDSADRIEALASSAAVPDLRLLDVRADAGGEGGVIVNSAQALLQGFYPATNASNTRLANGTTITSPLSGYVYVPITSVEPVDDVSLEGWTDCPAFSERTQEVYDSAAFKQVENDNAEFLQSLKPLVGGRSVSLANMWNIFDYMNVNNIHNETFHNAVSNETMAKARDLANYHESAVFTDADPSGVGHLAGRTIIPSILDALNDIANSTSSPRLVYFGLSYKPFLSLFNLTELSSTLPGIVDYASVVSLELRQSTFDNTQFVQFNFHNSSLTSPSELAAYPLFGQERLSLSELEDRLSPHAVKDLQSWCVECGQTSARGCDRVQYALDASPASTLGRQDVSPLAAGFIGAAVGLVVAGAAVGLWQFVRSKLSKGRKTPEPPVLDEKLASPPGYAA